MALGQRSETDDRRPGPDVLGPQSLAQLRRLLEQTALIVELRFHRRSRSPERRVFENLEELDEFEDF